MDEQALDSTPASPLRADKSGTNPDITNSAPPVTGTFKDNPPFIDDKGIPIPGEISKQDNAEPPKTERSKFQNIIGWVPDTASSNPTGVENRQPATNETVFDATKYPLGHRLEIGTANFMRVQEKADDGTVVYVWRHLDNGILSNISYSDTEIKSMYDSRTVGNELPKPDEGSGRVIESPFTKEIKGNLRESYSGRGEESIVPDPTNEPNKENGNSKVIESPFTLAAKEGKLPVGKITGGYDTQVASEQRKEAEKLAKKEKAIAAAAAKSSSAPVGDSTRKTNPYP